MIVKTLVLQVPILGPGHDKLKVQNYIVRN
jgi:hypothetical protein